MNSFIEGYTSVWSDLPKKVSHEVYLLTLSTEAAKDTYNLESEQGKGPETESLEGKKCYEVKF